MKNLADRRPVVLPPTWREDVIAFDGDQPIVRCPWITGQDPGVDMADEFDRNLDLARAS